MADDSNGTQTWTLSARAWFYVALACACLVAFLIGNSTALGEQTGSVASSGGVNVRSAPFNAKGDGQVDDTGAIQAAIDASARVYLPAGIYRIDPGIGLRLRTGTQLHGDGPAKTILLASPGGGTVNQLAAYAGGSILHRDFNPNGANAYVAYVRLTDFGVLLSHPSATITQDAIQIGIDFRNISRSTIERVHVGNTPPLGSPVRKREHRVFDSQGYGIVFGSVPSSLPPYAGGELNAIRDSYVWGAYKGIVQDDEVLSPRSAAHGTLIDRVDIQGAQHLLSQESIYARAFVWRDNILQNVIPQPGGNDKASVLRIEGSDANVSGGYVEAGGLARYLVYLGPSSTHVAVALLHASCTGPVLNVDRGIRNAIRANEDCAASVQPS